MKAFALMCLFVAGAMANTVSVSYGTALKTPPSITYGAPEVRAAPSYAAPAPVLRAAPYSAPLPEIRVPSYAAPVTRIEPSYSAPAPVVRAEPLAYSAPAVRSDSYGAPAYGSSSFAAPVIPITRYSHELTEGQGGRLSFETGHGISHEESLSIRRNPNAVGTAQDPLAGSAMITKTGSYSYMAPDGQQISLQYVADENGFRPVGNHLPTPPPIPAEIQEALRQIKAAESAQPSSGYGSSYSAPAPLRAAPY